MNFLTRIKLSNITNLSDARYAAAAGMDYLGFCFDPANPDYVPAVRAKEIMGWIAGSYIVAEFGDQPLEEIETVSELLEVDAVELNNRIIPQDLKGFGKPLIKKINTAEYAPEQLLTELEAYDEVVDVFHLYSDRSDAEPGATLMNSLFSQFKIIWGLPVQGSVKEFIETYKPYGLNISGGTEEKAGIRDFDELNDLLAEISNEE